MQHQTQPIVVKADVDGFDTLVDLALNALIPFETSVRLNPNLKELARRKST
jgi:hypothetical protein